jgi:hypothetical protein
MPRAWWTFASILSVSAGMLVGVGAEQSHLILRGDEIKWQPAPSAFSRGAMMSVLSGDPSKDGMFIVRVKMPSEYVIPPHWHSKAENVSVLSGTFHIGMGDKLDKANSRLIPPNGFAMLPASMRHFAWSSSETIIQISGMGPFDIHYVNPQDDPREKETTGSK